MVLYAVEKAESKETHRKPAKGCETHPNRRIIQATKASHPWLFRLDHRTSIVVIETFVVTDHHRPKRLKRRRREVIGELSVLGNAYAARAFLVSSIPIYKKKIGGGGGRSQHVRLSAEHALPQFYNFMDNLPHRVRLAGVLEGLLGHP
jgi:hypothetical protein